MNPKDLYVKRLFDLLVALIALTVLWPVIGIGYLLAAASSGGSGIFSQTRVGRGGKCFTLYKLRTMHGAETEPFVTIQGDARITPLGRYLRRFKIDELPQLWNVLKGDMSIVGPRPDMPGYIDQLDGADRMLLLLRPGITGPATLKYRNEEKLLAEVEDPQNFNDRVIWPDKVRLNLEYMRDYSLANDLRYVLATIYLIDHGVR